jgi:stage V sporulation protein R
MIPDKDLIVRAAAEMEMIAGDLGFSCWPQVFEWVTPEQMSKLIARDGTRLKYPHWSYAKQYRHRLRQAEVTRDVFDAHELVFNSNPCVAYLVANTVADITALVIGHVYGHNDFFRSNIAFRDSNPEYLLPLRFSRAQRVRELEDAPGIGIERVEAVLDAARSVMYHRIGFKPGDSMWLEFFMGNPRLEDWERDLVLIVNEESKEDLRIIQTKVMNEGWAASWEMDFISRSTKLPYWVKNAAAKHHAILTAPPVKPTLGYNPYNIYNIGMLLWRSVADRFGRDALFAARAGETDAIFVERYLTQSVGIEANLAWLEFNKDGSVKKMIRAQDASLEDWGRIKAAAIAQLPMNSFPLIVCEGIEEDNTLAMQHFHDGRDLDMADAKRVVSQVARTLWKGPVLFTSELDGKKVVILSNSQGEIS